MNIPVQELKDGVYVVKDGQLKTVQTPPAGFGKTVISWEGFKPTRVLHEHSEKL